MPLTKTYLTAYNALNVLLWSAVLYHTAAATLASISASTSSSNSAAGRFDAIYPSVGALTKWTQSLIVLDVVHVLLGLVRTSLFTTLVQAFSRIFIVWAVVPASPASYSSPFYALMVFSWAIADLTRYSFHVAAAVSPVVGRIPGWLTWARYNFFFVLYLTGAGSEWMCMWKALPVVRGWKDSDGGLGIGSLSYWTVVVMLVAWPIFFPNQYLHMMALRRKVMRKIKS